ncbi:MAG: hypothetical protein OHK0029_12300 [Armatimonadaceae bacterium]
MLDRQSPRHFSADFFIKLAVIVFCAWQARNLLHTWQDAPIESGSVVLFLVWLLPGVRVSWSEPAQIGLGIAAVVFAALRSITDLNVLAHVGLALAVAALPLHDDTVRRGLDWRRGVYVLGAIAWFPAFGWAVPWEAPYLLALRAAVVLCTVMVRISR